MDSITSVNQLSGAYWKKNMAKFDERKYTGKEYPKTHMEHNKSEMAHRWSII
jgi:hypothetical protein